MTHRKRFEAMVAIGDAELVNNNVFLLKKEFDLEAKTIKGLLTWWGVHRHFDHMVEHLSNLAPDKENRMVVVQYDIGAFDVNHDEQKMLSFNISDNNGKHIMNGGVLFQHGEMSFHT